jgi:hypothetical protein
MKGGRVESHGRRQHSAVTQGKKVAAGGTNSVHEEERGKERKRKKEIGNR